MRISAFYATVLFGSLFTANQAATVAALPAPQYLSAQSDSLVIPVKGCTGDRGAKYKDFADCTRRRGPRNAGYCQRICS